MSWSAVSCTTSFPCMDLNSSHGDKQNCSLPLSYCTIFIYLSYYSLFIYSLCLQHRQVQQNHSSKPKEAHIKNCSKPKEVYINNCSKPKEVYIRNCSKPKEA